MTRRLRTPPPPRGIDRIEAASYVGIGVELFDRGVACGMLPKPRQIFSRLVWDIYELDRAFDAIPHKDEEPAPSLSERTGPVSERDAWLNAAQ